MASGLTATVGHITVRRARPFTQCTLYSRESQWALQSWEDWGSPIDRGPIPGCFMVFVASDSEMMFGQQCPRCNGYWRSRAPSRFCPYCDLHGDNHAFLTDAQGAYIQQYSALMAQALDAPDGEHVIDLDAVADSVSSVEKPPFYYSEERQQNKFTCEECGNIADVLGRFWVLSSLWDAERYSGA